MWPFSKTKIAEVEERAVSPENPAYNLSDPAMLGLLFTGTSISSAGVHVSPEAALSVPAVWAATNFLSGTVAALPLDLYRRDGDNRVAAGASDPLGAILKDEVNDDHLTSFMWRKNAMQNVLLYGRSFDFIERNKAGRVMNIWPLDPRHVTIERVSGRRQYQYKDGDKVFTYATDDIIDMPWMLAADGLCHYNPVAQFKNAIGLAMALEQYAARFFENGGIPPLALHGPMPTGAGVKRASEDIAASVRNAQAERRSVLVLPAGHELKPIGIDPAAGQMEEARAFQLTEFARWFGLPPVFLQDLSNGTYSNTEQQDLHFVKHTLMQWLKAWEQELNAKLFPSRNRKNFVEFNQDGLLRGDFKSRMEGYATAVQNGLLTPNEIRGMENRPAEGGDANKLHIQGATVPLGEQVHLASHNQPPPQADQTTPAPDSTSNPPQ